MTKPITGVALMSLYEKGVFQLDDPVHRWIPEWRGMKVEERADDGTTRLVDPVRPVSVKDALMHMTGFGMGTISLEVDAQGRGFLDGDHTL